LFWLYFIVFILVKIKTKILIRELLSFLKFENIDSSTLRAVVQESASKINLEIGSTASQIFKKYISRDETMKFGKAANDTISRSFEALKTEESIIQTVYK